MTTSEDLGKHKTVLTALRQWIVAHGQPGSRLPTRHELAAQYGVSPMTAQRAFDQLATDGFVVTRGRGGTFVVDEPPHFFRYGIIFSSDPTGGESDYWPPAWHAFHQEAMRVQHVDRRRTVVPFFNVTGHGDSEDFQALIREMESSRLAGLIFGGLDVPASSIFEEITIPKVTLGCGPSGTAVSIGPQEWAMVEPALDALAASGCRRIAMIDIPGRPTLDASRTLPAIKARGMESRSYWLLGINHQTHHTAKEVVQLLMSGRPDERPDGLFILNPFLVETATLALAETGIRIPQDLKVLAGGNFPYLTRSHVPVRWLGVDIREMMWNAIDLIDRQRRGEAVPRHTCMYDIFEEQVSPHDPLKRLVEA